jgi:Tfp pilus assembly protein PilO
MASMSDRDRKILMAIVPILVIVAYWFLLLAPKRQEASAAAASAAKQEQRRDSAEAQLAAAAGAKTDFRSDYTQIVRLGKAIPSNVDMPSLLVQLEGAAKGTGIHFTKIATGERTPVATAPAATAGSTPPAGGESSGSTPATPAAGTTPATPAPPAAAGGQPAASAPGQAAEGANNTAAQANSDAAAQSGVDPTTSTTAREGGLPIGGGAPTNGADGSQVAQGALETVPLELEFTGNFFKLADFFHSIKRFVHVVNQNVVVNGRLVTIDSVNYASDPILFPGIRAQIKATVYLSPKTEGATAGATPEGPTAVTPGTTPAAAPAPSSTPSPAPTATATP